jgi:hypothetical protein
MKELIETVNKIETNVWAIVALLLGAITVAVCVVCKHETSPGTMIIGGSLAILQHKTPVQ